MSSASPAHNQVRRNVATATSRAPQPQAQAHAYAQPQAHAPVRQPVARTSDFSTPRGEEEIRLNLRDIPRMDMGDLDVEGFKPSLLSRLFDMLSPLNRR